jgi:hypothetical protein
VVSVYQGEVAAAQQLGQTQAVESTSQYQQQVNALSPSALAQFYSVTQQNPEWVQIPSLMQTIVADVPTSATQTSVSTSRAVSASPSAPATATLMAVIRHDKRRSATTSAPAILVGDTTPVGPFNPTSCDTTDYDEPIFVAQIVVDVSTAVYNGINPFASFDDSIPAGLAVAADVILTAAQIVHDVISYLQTLENDCDGNQTSGYIANIDNTTVATYNLLTTMGSSIGTILSGVQNIQTGLTTFQQTLTQALISDTQALQTQTGSDFQGLGTQMQTMQTALQSDAATIESLETTTGQQAVTGSTAVQTAISTDLAQILNETDSDAQGLTTLVTQGNQQIMNTVNSEAATAQAQYNTYLKLQIEQALAGFGPVVPELKFMLPVTQGGFLNSTPVGVQSVVTADLASMQTISPKTVKPAAITQLSAANAALAAKNYTLAFSDYAYAYQALA